MDPLTTNRPNPATRISEQRDGQYEPPPRRRRPAPPAKPAADQEAVESTEHKIDDLA